MKRFGIQFGAWLSFFFGGIVAIGLGAQLHPRLEVMLFAKAEQYGHTIFRIPDFAERDEKPDLIALGSSTCYRGLDPRPFAASGLDAFNLCSSSQSCFNSRFLLDWAIGQEKAPTSCCSTCIPMLGAYPV